MEFDSILENLFEINNSRSLYKDQACVLREMLSKEKKLLEGSLKLINTTRRSENANEIKKKISKNVNNQKKLEEVKVGVLSI